MAKFAVQISGELRHAKAHHHILMDRIINPLKADVFCHTWTNPKSTRVDCNIAEFAQLYNPKMMIVEPTKNYEKKVQHMFRSLDISNECRKMVLPNYDYVVRLRTDMVPDSAVNVDEILGLLSEKDVIVPRGNDWLGGLNDQFAIMRSGRVSDFYHDTFQRSVFYDDPNPETALKEQLLKNNIKIGRWNYPYSISTDNYVFLDQTVVGI